MTNLTAELCTTSSLGRQMYLAVLGQMAMLLGSAYFFVTYVK